MVGLMDGLGFLPMRLEMLAHSKAAAAKTTIGTFRRRHDDRREPFLEKRILPMHPLYYFLKSKIYDLQRVVLVEGRGHINDESM